jgi:type I restriction enzyme S subunit
LSKPISNLNVNNDAAVDSIPQDWELTTIYELGGKLKDTVQTGPFGAQLHASDYVKEGIPLVLIRNIDDNQLKTADMPRISVADAARLRRFALKENDVIFSRVGRVGSCYLASVENEGWIISGQTLRIRLPDEAIDQKFLLFSLQGRHTQEYITKVSIGSTRKSISTEILESLPVLVPPRDEQSKIATILSVWDRAIELANKQIAAKQRLKLALARRLLTGKLRFPQFVTTKDLVKTKFISLPRDWEYVQLNQVAEQVLDKNEQMLEIPVLSCTKYTGLVDSLAYFGKRIFSKDLSTYKLVSRGYFAYATNHIEEGSIGYQDLYDQALVSPMYTVFRTKGNILDGYLFRLLKTELYRHIFEISTSASVNRRGGLRWNDFSKIKIPLPSREEQSKICESLKLFDSEIKSETRRRDVLLMEKRGLMQKLLTGEVRVTADQVRP